MPIDITNVSLTGPSARQLLNVMLNPSLIITKFGQTLRPRSKLLLILSLLLVVSIPFLIHMHVLFAHVRSMPSHHRYNAALENAPKWARPYVNKVMYKPAGLLSAPSIVPGLRNAPWAGSWKTPVLTSPIYEVRSSTTKGGLQSQIVSPALLMLHIFSTPFVNSRRRRQLIRETELMQAVPEAYRHLIEIKFVMGLQQAEEGEEGWEEAVAEEVAIKKEMEIYGDIVRLRDLEGQENMNNGKSWEWIRYVGREGGREAWWVLKCDDDTLPLLPNLLPMLLSHDPSEPTYLGSALGRWTGYHYYFQGMMYGLSWGVVKTLAVADVPRSTRNYQWDEDARMGGLMFSLPLTPAIDLNSPLCNPPDVPDPRWSMPPPSPNPCTGLVSLDLGGKIGAWGDWMIGDEGEAFAWHPLKSDEDYKSAYRQAVEGFDSRGKEYLWEVPEVLRSVADI